MRTTDVLNKLVILILSALLIAILMMPINMFIFLVYFNIMSYNNLVQCLKEAMFEMAVRKDSHEERQNQLRWQVKIGADHMADKAKQEVLANRTLAWQQYKVST